MEEATGAGTMGTKESERDPASGESASRAPGMSLETLYRTVEQWADLIVLTDAAGRIEYVNPAFEKLTGYRKQQVLGQTPRILKSGERAAGVCLQLCTTIRAGKMYRNVMIN